MKNTMIRAFVVALALTGAVSTVHANNAKAHLVANDNSGALPVPLCPPNDPNACGLR